MKKYSELAWYLFMLCVVPPAFMIAPRTSMMSMSEIFHFAWYTIYEATGSLIANILYYPVGFVAYFMPNDMGYFVMFFQIVFMAGGTFLTFIFFATTYPPKCLQEPKSEYENEESKLKPR